MPWIVCTTAGTRSCQAAARPRMPAFETMRMNDVGLQPPDRRPKFPVSPRSVQGRIGREGSFRHHLDLELPLPGTFEWIRPRALRRPGNERHFIVVLVLQVLQRE